MTTKIKWSAVVLASALAMSSGVAHASLAGEVLDFARALVRGKDAVQVPALIKGINAEFRQSAQGTIEDSAILLKEGGMVSWGTYAPSILIRKGLYKNYNNPGNGVWISVMVRRETIDSAMIPGTSVTGLEAFGLQFSNVIEKIVEGNPTFNLRFVQKYSTGSSGPRYHITGNVNHSQLEVVKNNRQNILVEGTNYSVFNIPVQADDSIEDVMTFIKAMDEEFKVVTSLEG